MQEIKIKKFEKMFYKIIIVILIALAILFFILNPILNEEFFLKYSPDKQLKEETIGKIRFLQYALLLMSTICLFFILLLVYFKNSFIGFANKHKNLIQNIILLIAILIIIFVVSEIILKIIFNEQTFGGGFGPGSLKFNEKYVNLNNDGMRDREFSLVKSENIIRIAVIGDSFTFGSGIKNINETYPKILEKNLNFLYKEKYEVLNFGIPGKDTEAEIQILKEKALKYHPDIVIIGYVLNDFKNVDSNVDESDYLTILPYFGFWTRNFFYSYAFFEIKANQFLEKFGLKANSNDILLKKFKSSINKEYNKKLFEQISDISKENNFRVLIVIFPATSQLKTYPFLELHKYIINIGKENKFYVVDLFEIFKNYNEEQLIVSKYDQHPNEFGHKLAAEAILEKLINNSIIK